MRFLRLCLLIFVLRRFLIDPMVVFGVVVQRNWLRNELVERILNDAFCP